MLHARQSPLPSPTALTAVPRLAPTTGPSVLAYPRPRRAPDR